MPELAGAVTGFANSSEGHDGRFILVDVGGLTVDCAFFRIGKVRTYEKRIGIYASATCQHGVDVTEAWLDQDNSEAAIPPLIGSLICDTLKEGSRKLRQDPLRRIAERTPVFFVGGGGKSELYRAALPWAIKSLKNSVFETELVARDLSPDRRDLDTPLCKGIDHDRLLVACGLSHDIGDILEWVTPDQIQDGARVGRIDVDARMVGKEQV
ncbi:hypothetical protein FHG66_20955 [Rubellimicrobium rubrum]|uniref:Uncharacterized protein n=1 Tax=Rubellimicrobium rubrum TaxID=2585369 RepID=A0A5C4MIS2_9RHOB|nr:hypothetical protein [Rubellimicrobium rubrum]TNC43555.1 hypothetical protein FHG66_20955 [Rubellimicrobium rubrum]